MQWNRNLEVLNKKPRIKHSCLFAASTTRKPNAAVNSADRTLGIKTEKMKNKFISILLIVLASGCLEVHNQPENYNYGHEMANQDKGSRAVNKPGTTSISNIKKPEPINSNKNRVNDNSIIGTWESNIDNCLLYLEFKRNKKSDCFTKCRGIPTLVPDWGWSYSNGLLYQTDPKGKVYECPLEWINEHTTGHF